MKNASRKTEVPSANLGTKRGCPKCSTKFYDFNKQEISCPKCKETLDLSKLNQPVKIPVEVKKPPKVEKTDDPAAQTEEIATDEPIEAIEELGDDDEEVVEEIEVEEEEESGGGNY